jgi:hypothetical protein
MFCCLFSLELVVLSFPPQLVVHNKRIIKAVCKNKNS